MRDAEKVQPMPTKGGVNVLEEVIADLRGRDRIGTEKYGATLQTNNGRDALLDAFQEALDLVMYLKQAILEREAGHDPHI